MSADKAGEEAGMPAADVTFLIECLKHTSGGSIAIDTAAVAKALNYKNHRSVGNRIATMKKKYDLPISTTAAKGKAGEGSYDALTVPKTEPKKNKITKPRAAPAKKVKQEVKAEDGDNSEGDDGEADLTVRTPEYLDADEELLALAGQSSEEESEH